MPPGPDDEDMALWHALHEDGDQEDLEESELLLATQHCKQLKTRAAQRQAAAFSRAKDLLQTAAEKESGSESSTAHVQGASDGGPVFTIGQDVLCEQVWLCECDAIR